MERSGVGSLLRTLEKHMGLHGMRLHELFNMMDTSGDGVVDRAELMTALVAVTAPGPGPEARFVMQRHARALAEAEGARRAKRAADRAPPAHARGRGERRRRGV